MPTSEPTSEMNDSQRSTYESVFQHPVPRDLHWPEMLAMLKAIAQVAVGGDGAINAQRNGQSLALARPLKKIASVQEVMDVRRFLERCNAQEAQ